MKADLGKPESVSWSETASEPCEQLLASLGRSEVLTPERARRVFVNRHLRMDQIEVIGFDMDYTLALYNQPRLEALSASCTLEKMIARRGYPEALRQLPYDSRRAIRGLVVDRERGNVLKMDRYGYVGRAYHGTRPLPRAERRKLYREQLLRILSTHYAFIDTLFALPEAVLFGQIVDFFDADPAFAALSDDKKAQRYSQLWADIRESIDEAHRDDSIKRVIKADMATYIAFDPELPATLHRFRSAGKRLFLLTNSGLDYTQAVMSYLLDKRLPGYASWRSYFDVIVVDAKKPSFFTEQAPLLQIDPDGKVRGALEGHEPALRGRLCQGGNVQALDRLLGLRGDRVLYVGDHIYGDMYRAKRASVWRTAMIIQELEDELQNQKGVDEQLQQMEALERRRHRLEAELRYDQLIGRQLSGMSATDPRLASIAEDVREKTVEQAAQELHRHRESLRQQIRATDDEMDRLEHEIEQVFNPYFGPLLKAAAENSRFGQQVEDFACVYTSRVSNFLQYAPFQHFRSPRDHLPHERVY
ncbi:MAG TPA: HAD-IG family 5'-nucleotidase [Pseudomonadota bacterium]|nr:HAD-IG family 5'-nucleotidase [Pseudomonadota bacterium]